MTEAGRPLDGVRVLDFTRVLAGPYCTALLADLGADVLKVEPPQGDDYRQIGPFRADGSSAIFAAVNRGKRSVVLDLGTSEHREVVLALAAAADVVVENFRPGVAAKLGIGAEVLCGRDPRLIYASISGFGQDGPNAQRPAYDIVVQAMSGIMTTTGEPDGPPMLLGEAVGDVVAGLFGSWAILAALYERERTGRGRRLDVAMLDAMMALQPLNVARYLALGRSPRRVGNRHPISAPFGAFAARDGQFVLAVLNKRLFASLAGVVGRPDLPADPRFATDALRFEHEAELRAVIEAWAGGLSAAEAVAALMAAGVPAAEVQDTAAALAAARAVLQTVDEPELGPVMAPEQPVRFVGATRGGLRPAPRLGQHDKETLGDPARAWG